MDRRALHRCGSVAITAVAALAVSVTACSRPQMVRGECQPVHGGDVCVWGEVSGNTLLAFGATVPMRVVEHAPEEVPMAWPPVPAAVIALPEAVASATGFTELTVFWEPHGHPPGPYLTPHFDFHFYSIPTAARAAIDCTDASKPPQLATGYELPDVTIDPIGDLVGLCVPGMGMHALPASELHATTPFEKTMVLGYYQGRSIFVEPMLTSAALRAGHSFTLDIPEVPGRPAASRYPRKFRADYDAVVQEYTFTFHDFTGGAS